MLPFEDSKDSTESDVSAFRGLLVHLGVRSPNEVANLLVENEISVENIHQYQESDLLFLKV